MGKDRRSELYYEEIGSQFDQWMSPYDVERRIRLVNKLLPPGAVKMSCLEVGCGTGRVSEALLPAVGKLTVSDISEDLAKRVGERLQIDSTTQDACGMDVPDDFFDLVVSSECIEHTPNPAQALAEMVRVLKPGGFLVVTSPNRTWYPVLWVSVATGLRNFQGNENWLFPWSAARILKRRGLRHIKIGGCHLFPWQLPLAQKLLPIFDQLDRVLYPLMINWAVAGQKAAGGSGSQGRQVAG